MKADKDSVYIGGLVKLWNTKSREPDNPIYISLAKKSAPQQAVANPQPVKDAELKEVLVYPNPFKDFFTVRFYLQNEGEVALSLYDVNGKLLYHKKANFSKGYNEQAIASGTVPGTYVIQLKHGNFITSKTLIKQ